MSLYNKYRPAVFADVTGQEHVVTTLQNQIAGGSVAHAYLFCGPRGVGKTTVARLLARVVNCKDQRLEIGSQKSDRDHVEPCNECEACREIMAGSALDVCEIDAASHTDVENVRDNIIKGAQFAPSRLKRKVFIIDEAHMLSASAFNALLKTLEEPPAHAIFVLATTETHKVPATVVSRCQRFEFRRLSADEVVARLGALAKNENIAIEEDVLREIARYSEGCLRDAESLLGQVITLGAGKVTMETASLVLPASNVALVNEFIESLVCREAAAAVRLVGDVVEQGGDLQHFVDNAIRVLRERLMTALVSGDGGLEVKVIEHLLGARQQMKIGAIPQLPIELAVIKICGPSAIQTTPDAEPTAAVGHVALAELKQKWPDVLSALRDANASLPLIMRSADIESVVGDTVNIAFGFALHAETINRDKNRKILEETLTRVLGRPLKVRAGLVRTQTDETVSQLISEFGGSVV